MHHFGLKDNRIDLLDFELIHSSFLFNSNFHHHYHNPLNKLTSSLSNSSVSGIPFFLLYPSKDTFTEIVRLFKLIRSCLPYSTEAREEEPARVSVYFDRKSYQGIALFPRHELSAP